MLCSQYWCFCQRPAVHSSIVSYRSSGRATSCRQYKSAVAECWTADYVSPSSHAFTLCYWRTACSQSSGQSAHTHARTHTGRGIFGGVGPSEKHRKASVSGDVLRMSCKRGWTNCEPVSLVVVCRAHQYTQHRGRQTRVCVMHSNRPHTHAHTCLTALFRGLPRGTGTRKVKPIWISAKQETMSGSGISWAICKSAPCSRQITTPTPHHPVFYRPDALPAAQPTASKHWRPR